MQDTKKVNREDIAGAIAEAVLKMDDVCTVAHAGGTVALQTHDGTWYQLTVQKSEELPPGRFANYVPRRVQ